MSQVGCDGTGIEAANPFTGGESQREERPATLAFEAVVKEFRSGLRGRLRALDRVSLRIGPGEILGLLGPNGAGKTTLFKLALGLLRPSAGGGALLGRPLGDREARARVGYQPEQPYLYPFLTVAETLSFLGELARIPGRRLTEAKRSVVERCGLQEALGRQVRHLSRGWLQRLALAGALLPEPELLLLDEPLNGLDPEGRLRVKELIRSLRAAGCTIVINTHHLADIEKLADRIALLRCGRLVACGAMNTLLLAEAGSWDFELVGSARPAWLARGVTLWERRGEQRWLWRVSGVALGQEAQILRDLLDCGLQVVALNPVREDLEAFFARVMGRDLSTGSRRGARVRAA